MSASPQIPTTSFENWFTPSPTQLQDRLAIAHSLLSALQTSGFAYITNHSIPPSTLIEAFKQSQRFFSLSPQEKSLAAHPPGYTIHRGYSTVGQETTSNIEKDVADSSAPQDLKETFEIGSESHPSQPNQWLPESVLPGFRDWGVGFYWECAKLSEVVLTAIAMGLGLDDPQELLQHHSGHGNQLRLAHYPAIAARLIEGRKDGAQRCAAHCDFSSLTLLFQDGVGGLQVARDGEFVDVEPVEGSCVVNVGDVLMRWSNDRLKSTLHRVSLPPLSDRLEGPDRMRRERFSIPYFVAADPETVIQTLPQCVDEHHPAQYQPVRLDEYLMSKLQATYAPV